MGFAEHESNPTAQRCRVTPGREASQYDTSGDGRADVRKVYLAIHAGVDSRMVMICREADLDADGKKDVVRYYDDDGRSLREESDRDFDGNIDRALVFEDGVVVREELDQTRDGRIDTKIFFVDGKPSRAERDLGGRSVGSEWHPDRWEYYEAGNVVRMGTDLDGDSRVDRWERDAIWKRKQQAERAKAIASQGRASRAGSASPTEAAPGTDAAPRLQPKNESEEGDRAAPPSP